MPLYKIIQHDLTTKILIWEITESYEELLDAVILTKKNKGRLLEMKSYMHQCAFLSVRKLLQEINRTDLDLHYDENGKPHLLDGSFISITHSHQFSAIIISKQAVGIDIELQREKIIRLADKFVSDTQLVEILKRNKEQYINTLTLQWGAKEAVFKIQSEKGISFKNHITVSTEDVNDGETTAKLNFEGFSKEFFIYYQFFENFVLVYALAKD